MELIDRTHYPELDLILRDTKARYIEPNNALKKYEARWKYRQNNMSPGEKVLLDKLIEEFGKGVFLSA